MSYREQWWPFYGQQYEPPLFPGELVSNSKLTTNDDVKVTNKPTDVSDLKKVNDAHTS